MRSKSLLMRGPVETVAIAALLCGWNLEARAQTPPPLRVSRGADTRDCPDAAGLAADVATVRGPAAALPAATYSVGFRRSGATLSAVIRSGPAGASERTLEAPGQSCAALAHAVAVTLALLFDADRPATAGARPDAGTPPEPAVAPVGPTAGGSAATPGPAPVAPAPGSAPASPSADGRSSPDAATSAPAPASVPLADPAATTPGPDDTTERSVVDDHARGRAASLSLGAASLFGVVRPVAPAFAGELGAAIGPWRAGLGALAVLPQTLDLGPGTVRETLVSASLRVCYAPWRSTRARLDVCTGALAGLATGGGHDFSTDATRTQPWIAVPLELAPAVFAGPLGVEIGVGGLASLVRPDFSIDGLGVAYRSPLLGAMVSLRVMGRWRW
jgi:hypothetical protein